MQTKNRAIQFFANHQNKTLFETLRDITKSSNSRVINGLLSYIRFQISKGNTDLIELKQYIDIPYTSGQE